MTEEEKEGVVAIQYLQKMAGINESEEKALRGWTSMADWEKESTRRAYKMFKK